MRCIPGSCPDALGGCSQKERFSHQHWTKTKYKDPFHTAHMPRITQQHVNQTLPEGGCVLASSFWALFEHGHALSVSLNYQSNHRSKQVHPVCRAFYASGLCVVHLRASMLAQFHWRDLVGYCLAGLLWSQELSVSFKVHFSVMPYERVTVWGFCVSSMEIFCAQM